MEFRILGPLEVLDGDRPVAIAGSKRRAVLALLLLHANEVVRTERLIDDLWGDHAPRNAAAALHTHVSRLRKALGPDVLVRREWGYALRTNPESFDLSRFERLVAEAEPLPARERSAKLAEALQLWRGPALADLGGEEGLKGEIARLEEMHLAILERRIDADLEVGRNADLVGEIEALVAAHPLRERLRGQLILALYRAGRQVEALEVYRETRRVLSEELGLEPSPELRELEKAILRQDPAITAAVPPPLNAGRPRGRSRRSGALLALLALALIGLGVAAAIVFAAHDSKPAAAHAALAAGKAGTSTVATSSAYAATSTQEQTVAHETTPVQSRNSPRRPPATRSATHVVVASGSARRAASRRTRTKTSSRTSAARTRSRTLKPRTSSTITGTKTRTSTVKPKVVTISDTFDGTQIDGTIWYQIHQGTGWPPLAQNNGRLELVFPPGTAPGPPWNNYGGHVGTRCQFPGDFDARVDYSLVQWPAANGMVVWLRAFFEPNNYGWAGTFRQNSPWGEQYSGVISGGDGGSTPLDDTSGTFRLVRRSGVITTYFLHKGQWIKLGSGPNRSPVVITLGADTTTTSPPARRDQVVVDFDNFTVTASNPICPAGAEG